MRTLKLAHIALCNIVANKRIVPELIQNDATVDKISNALLNLLNNTEERNKIITEFDAIEEKLETKAAKTELSDLLIDMLANKVVSRKS